MSQPEIDIHIHSTPTSYITHRVCGHRHAPPFDAIVAATSSMLSHNRSTQTLRRFLGRRRHDGTANLNTKCILGSNTPDVSYTLAPISRHIEQLVPQRATLAFGASRVHLRLNPASARFARFEGRTDRTDWYDDAFGFGHDASLGAQMHRLFEHFNIFINCLSHF